MLIVLLAFSDDDELTVLAEELVEDTKQEVWKIFNFTFELSLAVINPFPPRGSP